MLCVPLVRLKCEPVCYCSGRPTVDCSVCVFVYSVSFSFSLVSGSILSPVELVICAQLTPLSNHRQECRRGGRGAGRCVELCICHCLCHCVKEFGVVGFFLPPLPCCCYFVAWPSFWDSCLVSDNEGILVYVKLRLQIAPYAPYSWLCVALYSLGYLYIVILRHAALAVSTEVQPTSWLNLLFTRDSQPEGS